MPVYEIRIDLKTIDDKLFYSKIDFLCNQLSKLFPYRTADEYKNNLVDAKKYNSQYHLLEELSKINYFELQKIRSFPIFKEGRYKGGFIVNDISIRENPFKVAQSLIGSNESGVAEKPKWVNFGSRGFSNNRLFSSSFELKLEGTQYISTVTMLAHAPKNDLEYSNNPTYRKQGQAKTLSPSGSIPKLGSSYPKAYGTTMYVENNEQVAKNIVSSSFIDSTGSYEKQTYISKG